MTLKQRRLSDRFAFAQQLQSATTERDLLAMTRSEVERTTGYHRCWLYLLTPDRSAFELIEVAGEVPSEWNEHCLILPVAGDLMLEEVAAGKDPVVVVDARLDPRTNQDMVQKTGSRTLISIPVRLADYPLGGLGTGTFAHEGVRAPSSEDILILVDVADQVAIALARIRNQLQRQSAQSEQDKLLSRLGQLKRQESLMVLASALVQEQNQLLDAAMGCVAELAEHGLNPTQLLDLQNLRRTLERMTEISRSLSRFGKRRLAEELHVDINQMLTEILSIVARLLPANVTLETQFQADLPTVLGDASMLEEVFLSLILAAKEAMPQGGKLSLLTRQQGPWVECEVRHAGCNLHSLLGAGLQESLCDYILRQHEGSLDCSDSELGALCLVRLPVHQKRPVVKP